MKNMANIMIIIIMITIYNCNKNYVYVIFSKTKKSNFQTKKR